MIFDRKLQKIPKFYPAKDLRRRSLKSYEKRTKLIFILSATP
jgi:hypothetical protein